MKLMTDLCDPEKNDRDWFRSRVALWKYVKNDWNAFVATLLEKLMEEVDETIPLMLPKDLVFTIYRDAVRAPVSNILDKFDTAIGLTGSVQLSVLTRISPFYPFSLSLSLCSGAFAYADARFIWTWRNEKHVRFR